MECRYQPIYFDLVSTSYYLPSFRYTAIDQFDYWHTRYMGLITYFVAPLMLLQIGLTGYQGYYNFDWLFVVSVLCIGLVWLSTAVFYLSLVILHYSNQAFIYLLIENDANYDIGLLDFWILFEHINTNYWYKFLGFPVI